MTKLQKAVVNWLKKNVPVKKTKFAHTHVVQYFSAGRALDALMKVSCLKTFTLQLLVTLQDSPWSMEKSKEGAELRLEYREQAIDLMQELMRHKMFHRWSLSCRRLSTKMVFLERRKYLWPIVKRRKMTQTER